MSCIVYALKGKRRGHEITHSHNGLLYSLAPLCLPPEDYIAWQGNNDIDITLPMVRAGLKNLADISKAPSPNKKRLEQINEERPDWFAEARAVLLEARKGKFGLRLL